MQKTFLLNWSETTCECICSSALCFVLPLHKYTWWIPLYSVGRQFLLSLCRKLTTSLDCYWKERRRYLCSVCMSVLLINPIWITHHTVVTLLWLLTYVCIFSHVGLPILWLPWSSQCMWRQGSCVHTRWAVHQLLHHIHQYGLRINISLLWSVYSSLVPRSHTVRTSVQAFQSKLQYISVFFSNLVTLLHNLHIIWTLSV